MVFLWFSIKSPFFLVKLHHFWFNVHQRHVQGSVFVDRFTDFAERLLPCPKPPAWRRLRSNRDMYIILYIIYTWYTLYCVYIMYVGILCMYVYYKIHIYTILYHIYIYTVNRIIPVPDVSIRLSCQSIACPFPAFQADMAEQRALLPLS